MASVLEIASVLREGDIKALCVEFNIPKTTLWRVPAPEDRASIPPAGYITIYEAHLRSGARLPLPSELEAILRALRIPLAQLHANAVRYICTLCIFSRKLNQRFRMSGLRVVFKLNRGSEWTSLTPRPGFKISSAIYDSLKNWKDRYFFVKVGEGWPLATAWGEVPEAYFGTPSLAERSAYGWLLKAIEDNPSAFARDFLVSRAEARKADWGPPSPTQKSGPPVRLLSRDESKEMLIIRERTEEQIAAALETPSSSSSRLDYVAAGICCGVGSTSGPGDAEGISVDAGVVLAQPAAGLTSGAAWMESTDESALRVPEGSRAHVVGQSGTGPRARRAPRGKRPAVEAAPETAGEGPAGGAREDVKGPEEEERFGTFSNFQKFEGMKTKALGA